MTAHTLSGTDRARGCLAGLALGDAIGRPAEGMSALEIQEKWGAIDGFVVDEPEGSDDTEYALLTARTLLRVGVGAEAGDFAQTWLDDVLPQEGGFRGGFSEIAAIDNLRRGLRPPQSGDHIHGWSDGLAMRVAPLGIVAAGDPELAARLARADGAVSHSGEGVEAGVAVAVAVAVAMVGGSAEEAFSAALTAIPEDSWTGRNLRTARDLVESEEDPARLAVAIYQRLAVTQYYWADLAPEAVAFAMAAVLHGRGDFAHSMLFAVNLGRDADTNAAIAGAVSGAISGLSSFPQEWVDGLPEVAGSCLRVVAGIHPLDTADQLAALLEGRRS